MASAAILRSAARSLRLLQPLEQSGCLLGRRAIVGDLSPSTRLLSSSVPTEVFSPPSWCSLWGLHWLGHACQGGRTGEL